LNSNSSFLIRNEDANTILNLLGMLMPKDAVERNMETVYYTGFESPVGTIWAASTEAGMFQLDFARPESVFLDSIKRRIDARIVADRDRFSTLRRMMADYFNGRKVTFEMPLDLRGTEFQKAVWRAIYRIPYGKLSSYGKLAVEVGKPKAARAAGNAVGDNPISMVIPCHRVVRSDGSLGGYGGGLDLKCRLLGIEGVLPRPDGGKIEYPMTRDELLRYFFE